MRADVDELKSRIAELYDLINDLASRYESFGEGCGGT